MCVRLRVCEYVCAYACACACMIVCTCVWGVCVCVRVGVGVGGGGRHISLRLYRGNGETNGYRFFCPFSNLQFLFKASQ